MQYLCEKNGGVIMDIMSLGSLRLLALDHPKLPNIHKLYYRYLSIAPLPTNTSPLYHAAN